MKTKKRKILFRRKTFITCLIAALMLAVVVLIQIYLFSSNDSFGAEERAAAAVRQVAAQLHQQVDEGLRQLNVASVCFDGDRDAMLKGLSEHGSFESAEILPVSDANDPSSYIRYEIEGVMAKIAAVEDDAIQLRIPLDDEKELAATLDAQRVRDILFGAYSEDYGYAIYNAATGAYIFTNTDFADNGYYDTLLSFNENGRTSELLREQRAQAHIDGESGFYIAQQPTGIGFWSVALFIPEHILGFEPAAVQRSLWLNIASAVLQIALLAILVVAFANSIRRERMRHTSDEAVNACMLEQATEDAQIGIYIYGRRLDAYRACFDGLHFASDGEISNPPESFEAFAAAYGLEEGDAERLYEHLRELKSGERNEMTLICTAHERERTLRFELRCPACDVDCVIISVRDASIEAERADNIKEEENFRRLMLSRTSAVWQINLSRNRWYLTDGEPDEAIRHLSTGNGGWRDYNLDLGGAIRDYIHPTDYPRCADAMSIPALTAMIKSGRSQATLEYRVKSHDGYVWHRMMLRIFRSMDNGDLLANLYILNVDAEKKAELERQERAHILQQTLTALGGIYYGLYYVDLDSDLCYTAKSHGGTSSQLTQSYKAHCSAYVEQYVHPEDQETMRRILEPYSLRKSITEGNHLIRFEYRRRMGDRFEPSAIVIQAARFENGTIRDVVLAMRRYGNEKKVPESV